MKAKIFLLLLVFAVTASTSLYSQDASSPEYQSKKEALIGQPGPVDYTPRGPVANNSNMLLLSNCPEQDRPTCLKEPFDSAGAGWIISMPRNDDGSSALINFGFNFNLYGTIYNACYINNNGNITFTQPLATFTPFAFPSSPLAIVAPFFADVDTRPLASGVVYHKIESNRMTIVWDSVGYFGNQVDKRNTFQLIISDGTDPLLGIGNNVCFSYGDMNWTTGGASGGIGGFFGSPATVGVNKGDGLTYATLGRFNRNSNYYGGPSVDTNGVHYLDCQNYCLNASAGGNICPVAGGFPGGAVNLTAGNPYVAQYSFAAPEISQTVIGGVSGVPPGMNVNINNGLTCTFDVTWTPNCQQVGQYVVCFTGIDDFSADPCTTTVCVTFNVDCPLPVEMSSFTSVINGRNVDLNWSTATETNNSGFEVERTLTGANSWAKVGFVTGNGTTTAPHSYSYTDRGLTTGNYSYRLKQVDFNGNFEYHNLSNEVIIGVPGKFELGQNYPNPFNPSTKIDYAIPFDGKVSLTIYDNSGKQVATLVNSSLNAGYYTAKFDASSLASGVYYYKLSLNGTSNFTETKRMLLVK